MNFVIAKPSVLTTVFFTDEPPTPEVCRNSQQSIVDRTGVLNVGRISLGGQLQARVQQPVLTFRPYSAAATAATATFTGT